MLEKLQSMFTELEKSIKKLEHRLTEKQELGGGDYSHFLVGAERTQVEKELVKAENQLGILDNAIYDLMELEK